MIKKACNGALLLFLPAAVFIAALFAMPHWAQAYPHFSRQVGRDCTYCHTAFPKLNDTGRSFRANGYRFDAEGFKDVKDWTSLPVSFEAEVEALYNRTKSSGVTTENSDMKVEEVEVIAGGAFGPGGRVTALVMGVIEQKDSNYEAAIKKSFVQVNDIIGPAGEGRVNARAGQFDVGLDFMNPFEKAISNRYLASSVLNAMTLDQRAAEVNGSYTSEGNGATVAHRYRAGVSREGINSDDKLRGYYLTYAVVIDEKYSLGLLYRGGREAVGSMDVSYSKWGLGAEAEAGPFTLSAAYFRSEREGASDKGNYVAEALYFPMKKVTLGARYDVLTEKGRKEARSHTIMARYNILSNVIVKAEYRGLDDKDAVAGANEDETRLRLYLVALF